MKDNVGPLPKGKGTVVTEDAEKAELQNIAFALAFTGKIFLQLGSKNEDNTDTLNSSDKTVLFLRQLQTP